MHQAIAQAAAYPAGGEQLAGLDSARRIIRYRCLAAGIVALFVLALPDSRSGKSIVYELELAAFGLAHYCLSLHYSRTQVLRLARLPSAALPILSVALFCAPFVAAGAVLGNMGSALLVYFGIHHVLNEVHMLSLVTARSDGTTSSGFRTSATFFHASAYFAIVVHSREWLTAFKLPLGLLLLVSAVLHFNALRRELGTSSGAATLLRAGAFEACVFAFALAVYTFNWHVRWTDIVLYHFVYWLLFPTLSLRKRGALAVRRYVAENVVLVVGFGFLLGTMSRSLIVDLFNIGSFFHIATSFALSRAQPSWITRWFWPVQSTSPSPSPTGPSR